ncbi:MAG TPA: ABC transporter substrate-binding protein [Burkholderiales bacterium]|nr:ABC transporter substrate-binding protein [Burkholderiales bacterium]
MIKLALISEGVNTWPVYVAQSLGFWKSVGAEVDLTVTGSSIQQLDALKNGGFDIGFQQVDHIVRGVEQGADLFIFMGQSHSPELSLMVSEDINTVADLKGKTIIVDDAFTGYSLLLHKLFEQHGLKESDTHFKNVGGSQERFDAMKNGEGSACFINPPFDRNLIAAGLKSLGASSNFFPAYPGPIAATRRAWAREHKAELIAFIRGFNRAYGWLQDGANKAAAIQLLPARLNMPADAAGQALARVFSRPRPQITEEGVRQVMDLVWASESFAAAKGSAAKYLDLSYLEEASADARQ